MKIVYIVAGSGDSFYCQNCLRDKGLVSEMTHRGHDVIMVPLYLPLDVRDVGSIPANVRRAPVFFGAVNTYLADLLPGYAALPRWLTGVLDSTPVLKWAAARAGSTRPNGMEEMTLSLLRGEQGRYRRELEEMISWLREDGAPDVIHISNALLLGVAPRVKREFGCAVICTLQDEDTWVDAMEPPYDTRIWEEMAARGRDVDVFVPVSRYYADVVRQRLHLTDGDIRVVYPGVGEPGHQPLSTPPSPPVVGYLSRLSESLGLGTLVDGFLLLRRRPGFDDVRLHAAGGATADDRAFVSRLQSRIADAGAADAVDILDDLLELDKETFLRGLSVVSVPVPDGEAFGLYMLEAWSCGIPVVQPRVGAFPEIVSMAGGGVVYHPNTPAALADALADMLGSPDRVAALGRAGLDAVRTQFSVRHMAATMLEVYSEVSGAPADGGNAATSNGRHGDG